MKLQIGEKKVKLYILKLEITMRALIAKSVRCDVVAENLQNFPQHLLMTKKSQNIYFKKRSNSGMLFF